MTPEGRRGAGLATRLLVTCMVVALLSGTVVLLAVLWGVENGMADIEGPHGIGVLLGWVLIPAAAGLTVAAAVGWWAGSLLARPLRRLTAVVRRVADGDRTTRLGDVHWSGELAVLGDAVDTMADALAVQEAARRRVVQDVAHEIRTPLAALQAGLEELADGLVPADGARLSSLHDQSVRLARVVEDLGALASAEAAAPGLRRTPVDLADVARDVLADKLPVLRAAGVAARPHLAPAPVTGDAGRLHQVVGNLLDNVARYCGPGDTVVLTTAVRAGQAVLTVRDTGPGIEPEDLPRVTERLFRGRNAARVAGSGIGLAVVRELVEAHGGTLSVSPGEAGRGTAVEVRLPASVASSSSWPTATRSTPLAG